MKECLLKMAEQLNIQEKEKKDLNQWLYIFTKVGTILFLSSIFNSCFVLNFFRGLCQISDHDEHFPMIIGLHQRWKTLRDAKSSIFQSVLSTKIRGGRLSSKKPVCQSCNEDSSKIFGEGC